MSNHDDMLKQFCDVTGCDDGRGKFFLESSNWELEPAISSFFEHGGADNQPLVLSDSSESPDRSPQHVTSVGRSGGRDKRSRPQPQQGGVATLKSLQADSSSDEDDREAFFAGGSERSGQQILGPSKDKKDIVNEMFRSVRELGAMVAEEHEPSRSNKAFSGTGYKLGATADDHSVVPPPSSRSGQGSNIRSVRLQMYMDGFIVDDGPVRRYDDPNNAAFLAYVRRGEVPPELSVSGEVRVSLEDKRPELCPTVKATVKPFQGKGHMLGSPTPPTVGGTAPIAANPNDREANQRAAQQQINLDESQPVTSLQFLLSDGSRVAGRFNHTHTVADLRQFLITAEPSYQLQNFILLTSYPSSELSDMTKSIKDYQIQNSVVLLRLK